MQESCLLRATSAPISPSLKATHEEAADRHRALARSWIVMTAALAAIATSSEKAIGGSDLAVFEL